MVEALELETTRQVYSVESIHLCLVPFDLVFSSHCKVVRGLAIVIRGQKRAVARGLRPRGVSVGPSLAASLI